MTRIFLTLLVSISTTLLALQIAFAESAEGESSNNSSWSISKVDIGLSGQWKIGYPTRGLITLHRKTTSDTPSRKTTSNPTIAENSNPSVSLPSGQVSIKPSVTLEWETVDGEGVPVVFITPIELPNSKGQDSDSDESKLQADHLVFEINAKHGRRNRPMVFRLRDIDGHILDQKIVDDQERGSVLPVGQPWVVGIGKSLQLDQAAMQSTRGELASYSSAEIAVPSDLPRTHEGYSGVDLLVLATSDESFLKALSNDQAEAIRVWVARGGHIQIWAGKNAELIKNTSWISSLLREKIEGAVSSVDPGILESYLSSQKRLEKLVCTRFESLDAKDVELSLLTLDRKKIPVLFRHAYGFGQVQVFASDLDLPPLSDWQDRKLLLERLFAEHWGSSRDERSSAVNRSAFLGYDDLSGQVRSALDTFPRVFSGSLPFISTLIIILVLLLGPFDYFVLSKAWNRPVWTWWSLLIWSSSAVAGVAILANAWKPDKQIINSIEIIDFDYSTHSSRAMGFVHQYSGRAGRYDLSASVKPLTTIIKSEQDNTEPTSTTQLAWSGQPGQGLSGFDSSIRTDYGFPSYAIHSIPSNRPSENASERLTSKSLTSSVAVGLGMPTAASKSFRVDWTPSEHFAQEKIEFHRVGETDFIEGKWTNPMKMDLLNGVLVYRGWLYRLPSRIRPLDTIRITANDIPKDLARVLQRRKVVKDIDIGVPWDTSDVKNLDRLVEMLSLHKAAGGTSYTGLNHRYLKEIDLTSHLKLNRAILIGQLPEPVLDWSIKQGVEKMVAQNGQRAAFVRFVIPVTPAGK